MAAYVNAHMTTRTSRQRHAHALLSMSCARPCKMCIRRTSQRTSLGSHLEIALLSLPPLVFNFVADAGGLTISLSRGSCWLLRTSWRGHVRTARSMPMLAHGEVAGVRTPTSLASRVLLTLPTVCRISVRFCIFSSVRFWQTFGDHHASEKSACSWQMPRNWQPSGRQGKIW